MATVGQMVELGVSDSSLRRNEIYHVHPSQDRCQRVKIAVVGATGATGSRVVKHALARGHFITAVARHPERLSSADRLSAVRGDVLSPGSLTGSFDGVDVAISCIGPEKNLSPGTLMSVGAANILTECKRANVRRFVLQSGIGSSDGRELSWPNRLVVRVASWIVRAAIIDKLAAERTTQRMDMEWVIVRPVVLADKPAKGRYTAGPLARVAPLVSISFDDCADGLLRAATNEPNWIGKIVNVGS
jgi:putative NADH-flavin reductase